MSMQPDLPQSSPVPTARLAQLVLRVAYAYDALPFEVFQRLRATLAGDHNIAQALETARELVAVLSAEDLAFVLARLLVCTSDRIDPLEESRLPAP